MPQVMQPKPVRASPPPQLLPPSVHGARLNWRADDTQIDQALSPCLSAAGEY
jgi:hypothetical protein